jgi:MFS family permease
VACGATVANLYYAQPLLPTIAQAFGVSEGVAAITVTVSQLAYSAGLVLIVPLGDLLDRRGLISGLLAVSFLALAASAAAPSLAALVAAIGIAAVASVVVQILIPFASTLALEEDRGALGPHALRAARGVGKLAPAVCRCRDDDGDPRGGPVAGPAPSSTAVLAGLPAASAQRRLADP